jgi:hypothetical protein
VFLALYGCKKDKAVTKIDFGYNYFPLDTGSWIIYDVDSIVYNTNTGNTDTYFYQIKESVTSSFTDLEGNTAYRIYRYKRNDTTQNNWTIKDVWSARTTASQALKNEENIHYIKLIFPVKENSNWNGHGYNDLYEAEYSLESVDITKVINGVSIDSVAHVVQLLEDNFIEYKLKEESYARNIGLVKKVDIYLDKQNEGGYEYTETLNSYGKL